MRSVAICAWHNNRVIHKVRSSMQLACARCYLDGGESVAAISILGGTAVCLTHLDAARGDMKLRVRDVLEVRS